MNSNVRIGFSTLFKGVPRYIDSEIRMLEEKFKITIPEIFKNLYTGKISINSLLMKCSVKDSLVIDMVLPIMVPGDENPGASPWVCNLSVLGCMRGIGRLLIPGAIPFACVQYNKIAYIDNSCIYRQEHDAHQSITRFSIIQPVISHPEPVIENIRDIDSEYR